MNQKIFFAADQHFGQANRIRFSERPFISIEVMVLELIKLWNKKVSYGEFHLGDISLVK
jgi:calcineurin-like phosphoesterase family protein